MSLSRLLRPRRIAVFGGGWAAQVVRGCRECGYRGALWAVHPRRKTLGGEKCFASADALPAAPDAAFVAVNAESSVGVVGALAARGAGGAVCFASGFAEVGARGAVLQKRLIKAAGAMPFFGPNCYGFLNYLDGALLWPDQHGGARIARGVAIVAQSGNIALNLAMRRGGLRLAALITLGNQAAVGFAETIRALLDDRRITAVGMIMESVADAAALAQTAIAARRLRVPLIALKLGRSALGARAAQTHTASLAGDAAAADAFFRKYGIARVAGLPAFVETLKLLDCGGAANGRTLLSMSCSGGEAALVADACAPRRLRLRRFSPQARKRLRLALGGKVALGNPLDYHTFIWNDEDKLTETYRAALADGFALAMLVLDFPDPDRCRDDAWRVCLRALIKAQKQTGARAVLLATLNLPEEIAALCARHGIAALRGIDEALRAAEAAADIGDFYRRRPPPPLLLLPPSPSSRPLKIAAHPTAKTQVIDEAAAKRLLAPIVAVPPGEVVGGAKATVIAAAATAAARRLGFPVAVKGLGIRHKTETGAVVLDCRDSGEVRRALGAVRAKNPQVRSFLIEKMVGGEAELIVGARRDPQFGLIIALGFGGALAEVYDDAIALLPPVGKGEIRAALLSLRGAALLRGFRGRAKTLQTAADAAHRIAAFAARARGRILEMDVNPLIVGAGGAIAADALFICEGDQEWTTE